jgi:hypothetical protein
MRGREPECGAGSRNAGPGAGMRAREPEPGCGPGSRSRDAGPGAGAGMRARGAGARRLLLDGHNLAGLLSYPWLSSGTR